MAIVRQAAELGRAVRLVPPIRRKPRWAGRWDSPEIQIDLGHYRRLVRVDREQGRATVQAGVSMASLGVALGSWGLSMENGSRDRGQSLGAAISLGAHGSGARYGSVATTVSALRLIAADGTVIDCSDQEEPEIFNAARVGLGSLGVISEVTVRCEPGFNLRASGVSMAIDEALAGFDALAAGHDHVELSWLPGQRRARVVTADRSDEPADADTVHRSYRWFNRRRIWPPTLSYAFAHPDSGPALRRARALTASRRVAPLFPIEVSVTAGDDLPLSPTQGHPTVFVAGVAGLGGRPEWGGPHGLTTDALRALYPRWQEWAAVRDRLDPRHRFAQASEQS